MAKKRAVGVVDGAARSCLPGRREVFICAAHDLRTVPSATDVSILPLARQLKTSEHYPLLALQRRAPRGRATRCWSRSSCCATATPSPRPRRTRRRRPASAWLLMRSPSHGCIRLQRVILSFTCSNAAPVPVSCKLDLLADITLLLRALPTAGILPCTAADVIMTDDLATQSWLHSIFDGCPSGLTCYHVVLIDSPALIGSWSAHQLVSTSRRPLVSFGPDLTSFVLAQDAPLQQ